MKTLGSVVGRTLYYISIPFVYIAGFALLIIQMAVGLLLLGFSFWLALWFLGTVMQMF